MDAGLQTELSAALQQGERVLWSGAPQGGLLAPADALLIPFSLMWGGFVCFWEVSALSAQGSAFMAVWGIPFLIMGLYVVAGRFWVKAVLRKRTLYAVTDSRVIELRRRSLRSLALDHLPGLEMRERSGGRGQISFGGSGGIAGMYANTGMDWFGSASAARPMAFFDIPEARSVYRLVESSAAQARGGGSWGGAPWGPTPDASSGSTPSGGRWGAAPPHR